jgi:large subunit ribosomal protein L9
MKILLLEKIKRLGDIGHTVIVKDGYARNYLLTKKKAIIATKENVAKFNEDKKHIEKTNNEKKEVAYQNMTKLAGKTLTIVRQAGDDGRLYGSVSNKDVKNLLKTELDIVVPIDGIILDSKIKDIGFYNVIIILHPEVESTIKLHIVRSLEEVQNTSKDNTQKPTATR